MKELLMGNEAVALGALAAGVSVVSGYPGTPSTEVIETVAKRNDGSVYVEWSVNEKAALEVAAGASYAGARSMVTMKQVGLNVASDPLMCVNYIGVKGGMIVYVADDPGPISSQTEQDTRHFAKYAKIPVFDCSSPEEAYELVGKAFDFSEKYETPVILRSTTRVCHSCASIEVSESFKPKPAEGFIKDGKWVIFPRLSYLNKIKLEKRETELKDVFSSFALNEIKGKGKIGIACGGICFSYVADAIAGNEDKFTIFKVATPYPFPERLAEKFISRVDKIIVFEELDPVIEDSLIYLLGKKGMSFEIRGKRTGDVPCAGELSAKIIGDILSEKYGTMTVFENSSFSSRYNSGSVSNSGSDLQSNSNFNSNSNSNSNSNFNLDSKVDLHSSLPPKPPARPPVLCAGCPHRASFYAVKKAMAGKKAVFCGDIGCYTLGNAAPLNMVDTCLCMGAGITVAQGIGRADDSSVNFAFVGDSTFFASGMTGIVNAIYNKSNMVLVVLDNSTTAMTGHQPHPGMGITVMGDVTQAVDIEKILRAMGAEFVRTANPFDYEPASALIKEAADKKGFRAVIFKAPCAAIVKSKKSLFVKKNDCIGCLKCIRELGCPALSVKDGKAMIDRDLCVGCGLCSRICPKKCIGEEAIDE